MTTALSILAALLLLSLLVTIHELGHYTAGRLLGFKIVEFSVGMGPVLLKKTRDGIQYSLRALPIGGMCRFYGEDEAAADCRSFNAQAIWKRVVVVLSGPVMNLLFALLCALFTLSLFGDYMPAVYEVSGTDTPAYAAGLRVGDVITKIDGKRVTFYSQTVDMIQAVKGSDTTLTVIRNAGEVELAVHNLYNAEAGKNLLGVTISPERVRFDAAGTLTHSFSYITATFKDSLSFFGRLFQGNISSGEVAGPVGIIAYISEAVRSSAETVLRFAVLISASLGIMNLLPLPALDGGRLLFMIIEAVRGKAIPAEKEGIIHFVGLILLFGLIIFLTYNDITNLIRG